MSFRRHDLLDADPTAWAAAVARLNVPTEAADVVCDWARRGWPVIVRRRLADEDASTVSVAFQLPNAYGRHRLAISLPIRAVTPRAPLTLTKAADAAPASWRRAIAAVETLGKYFEPPTVYGGLLWQHVTGEPALRATSDLDLLWRPPPSRRVSLIDALSRLDESTVRVDGEIELAEGGAVAWRELRQALGGMTRSVLIKTIDGIAFRDASEILPFETALC